MVTADGDGPTCGPAPCATLGRSPSYRQMIGPEPAAQRGYGLIRCHSGPERHSKVYERLEIDRFLATVTCTSSMPIVWADCIRGVPALAAQKIKKIDFLPVRNCYAS